MAKKGKFDLSDLVSAGVIKEGEQLFFVSDPSQIAAVTRVGNSDFKVMFSGETVSVHAAAQRCLGQEPPNHPAQWFKNSSGKTLFELWKAQDAQD